MRRAAEWHANGRSIVYQEHDGRVTAVQDALAAGGGTKLFNALWPVHAGKVGGLAWRTLTFLAGLGLLSISAYGAWSYGLKLASRKPRRVFRKSPATAT